LIHLVTDGHGMPLQAMTTPGNGDERQQVLPLLTQVEASIVDSKQPRKRLRPKVLAADKGYDAQWLRHALRKRHIRGQIPKRKRKGKQQVGRPIQVSVPRFQQERCFAWLQRKYRRLVVRWERLKGCFDAFLSLAIIHFWLTDLLLVG
jgi:transposase